MRSPPSLLFTHKSEIYGKTFTAQSNFFRKRLVGVLNSKAKGDDSVSGTAVCAPLLTTKAPSVGPAPSNVATNELKKLFQHSGHFLLGILGSLLLGFISFPIFTRLFSVSDYGTIDLIAKILLLITGRC